MHGFALNVAPRMEVPPLPALFPAKEHEEMHAASPLLAGLTSPWPAPTLKPYFHWVECGNSSCVTSILGELLPINRLEINMRWRRASNGLCRAVSRIVRCAPSRRSSVNAARPWTR